MKVTVQLFATLRQNAGWKKRDFTLADGARLRDLVSAIHAAQPEIGLGSRVFYAAVNEEYAKGDHPLADGDTVGFFPPVSGGALREEVRQ